MRHSATRSLLERRDVIVVASVSRRSCLSRRVHWLPLLTPWHSGGYQLYFTWSIDGFVCRRGLGVVDSQVLNACQTGTARRKIIKNDADNMSRGKQVKSSLGNPLSSLTFLHFQVVGFALSSLYSSRVLFRSRWVSCDPRTTYPSLHPVRCCHGTEHALECLGCRAPTLITNNLE